MLYLLIQADMAITAWQLIMHGRFRLLDRWCEFVRGKGASLQVVSEDQWGQVLDFSRTVHEDLSNFDMNGAWTWILDEFVEHLRAPPWWVMLCFRGDPIRRRPSPYVTSHACLSSFWLSS